MAQHLITGVYALPICQLAMGTTQPRAVTGARVVMHISIDALRSAIWSPQNTLGAERPNTRRDR